MPNLVNCPSCTRKLSVPDDLIGKTVKCPTCGQTFTARDESPSSSPGRTRDEEGRRSARPRLQEDEPEDRYEDERPSRGVPEKPGKVQAVAIMMLIGGILAMLNGLAWMTYFGLMGAFTLGFGLLCCLWPGPYYGLVMGIMATIKGSQLLSEKARLQSPPKGIAIMQIINIINGDVPNCVMGIIALIFLNEPAVQRYFRGR